MAKKTIEPSYQTLSDLAELFGSCVYKAPAMQQSEKLDEAVLPKENKIYSGVVTRQISATDKNIYLVRIDDGQEVTGDNITSRNLNIQDEVLVMQKTNGLYTIFAGGGRTSDLNNTSFTVDATNFAFNVLPIDGDGSDLARAKYRMDAIDTQLLIDMIGELRKTIDALIDKMNMHTHPATSGTTSPTVDGQMIPTYMQDIRSTEVKMKDSRSKIFNVKYGY